MIDRSDYDARLRLFRYGVLVVIVVTFAVVLVTPIVFLESYLDDAGFTAAGIETDTSITTFLQEAIIAAVIAAVIGIVAYVAYYYFLKRDLPRPTTSGSKDTGE